MIKKRRSVTLREAAKEERRLPMYEADPTGIRQPEMMDRMCFDEDATYGWGVLTPDFSRVAAAVECNAVTAPEIRLVNDDKEAYTDAWHLSSACPRVAPTSTPH